jgi:hypothetical protein
MIAPVPRPEAAATDTGRVLLEERWRRRPFLLGLAIFGALVVLVGTLQVVGRVYYRPAGIVAAFFDALGHRDASAARGLLLPTGAEVDQPLLQRAVLASAGYTPPGAVRIGRTDSAGDQATVAVSFSLGGQRHGLTVGLRRDGHTTAGLFDRWRITDGLYPLNVDAPGVNPVLVAGTPISWTGGDATAALTAFPGGYRVSLPDQPLLQAAPVTAYAGITDAGGDSATGALQPTIKSSVLTAIDQQVRSYLDGCARSTVLTPDNCPFQAYSYYDVRDVRWKIVKYPEYTVDRDESGQVVVTTTVDGEADVTGREVYDYTAVTYPFSDSDLFSVSGTVTADGAGVTFRPRGQ